VSPPTLRSTSPTHAPRTPAPTPPAGASPLAPPVASSPAQAEQPPPLLALRSLSYRYKNGSSPLILDRVSLSAQRGEFVSFIGPSGCGKSTLLRLIAGLLPSPPNELQVAPKTEIGFVFQDPTLLPWLTVEDNIALPSKLRGLPPAERSERLRKLLRLVRLAERAHAYPHELSGGQKMRVSIARALTLAPQLLLLDEPFGALDEITREHLQEELLALHTAQTWCALFVTHSVAEAVFLSDRVFIMSAGPPGRIVHEVPITLPRTRNADTRLSPAYHAQVTAISRLLRQAENPAADAGDDATPTCVLPDDTASDSPADAAPAP